MDEWIGKLVSVTTQAQIRYTGIIKDMSQERGTLTLYNVRSMGTENRPVQQFRPPNATVFSRDIEFKAQMLVNLELVENNPELEHAIPPATAAPASVLPPQQPAQPAPAAPQPVRQAQQPAPAAAPAQQQPAPQAQAQAPQQQPKQQQQQQQQQQPPKQQQQPQPQQPKRQHQQRPVAANKVHEPMPAAATTTTSGAATSSKGSEEATESADGGRGERSHHRGGHRGGHRGRHQHHHQQQRRRPAKAPQEPADVNVEFDFEASKTKFEELHRELNDLALDDDGGPAYDKDDFFDSLQPDSRDRRERENNYALDMETFGQAAVAHKSPHDRRRRGRGRGGPRGGHRHFNPHYHQRYQQHPASLGYGSGSFGLPPGPFDHGPSSFGNTYGYGGGYGGHRGGRAPRGRGGFRRYDNNRDGRGGGRGGGRGRRTNGSGNPRRGSRDAATAQQGEE
ncbi:hypothetical protein PTSG_12713 [Salpingoeca rosetta]|uniref:DFDF domain-containing protein n=1 Tax=Salpingoeca rosetta (strain ATCC 50818 / BSB-021) TaxID=946362 RepID=F2UJH5_SALR5|nr:uncharacterized protein PTSG_12713 [Salpingoeca rosetta]EGD77274.1 hypothetical protein PTSG_12713 [Salpingoeca rosetta]|eukprot:XP_004990618.1 hypothetical protein PTSG_12713 [Salpingoeca rosetta]